MWFTLHQLKYLCKYVCLKGSQICSRPALHTIFTAEVLFKWYVCIVFLSYLFAHNTTLITTFCVV